MGFRRFLTPKAFDKTFGGRFFPVERLRRTCFLWGFTQGALRGCAASRPWALEYNRFAVKSQATAMGERNSRDKMLRSVACGGTVCCAPAVIF